MNDSEPFCGQSWSKFQHLVTNDLYGSMTLILEIVGIPLNTLTVLIFTKKTAYSPSNILFASLAVSDWAISVLAIPQFWLRISHLHIRFDLDDGSYTNWQRIIDRYSDTFGMIFYNVSLGETMLLAVWRYIAITHPLKERFLCNAKVTVASVICIYVFCILSSKYDLLYIFRVSGSSHNGTAFTDMAYGLPKLNFEYLPKLFYDLVDIVLLKLIPCTIVAICTARFVYVLRESKNHRKQMISHSRTGALKKLIRMNRTTKMVLGITTFFLINNTLLALGKTLIVVYGRKFEEDCSPAITCVNNTLAFIYTTIPFFVYYGTSQQFRNSFKSLFSTTRRLPSENSKVISVIIDSRTSKRN